MGDRQWPDPRGWESLTQPEAERDALRREIAECEQDKSYIWHRLVTRRREREELQRALAVAERERDQAREMCPACGHEWRRHDPADGRCDSFSDEPGYIGVCRCGRGGRFHDRG